MKLFILVEFDVIDSSRIIGAYSTRELALEWQSYYESKNTINNNMHEYFCIYEQYLISYNPQDVENSDVKKEDNEEEGF